jgi:hypothetical protein
MSEIVQFPGGEPAPEREWSEQEVDKIHAEAFRDLEIRISDCESMAKITAQLMSQFDNGQYPHVCFDVFHLNEMLRELKKTYYAGWEPPGEGAKQ